MEPNRVSNLDNRQKLAYLYFTPNHSGKPVSQNLRVREVLEPAGHLERRG